MTRAVRCVEREARRLRARVGLRANAVRLIRREVRETKRQITEGLRCWRTKSGT
jgi:hypothetical protein